MKTHLLAGAGALALMLAAPAAWAGQPTPLAMQVDRTANGGAGPYPICANPLSSITGGQCDQIGTMTAAGVFAPANALPLAGGNLTGPLTLTPNGGLPSTGAFATDGSQSYQPSNFGDWLGGNYAWTPVVGTGKNADGTPQLTRLFTQNIFQCQANGALGILKDCVSFNMDVVGGTQPNGGTAATNTVLFHPDVRRRPGPNGEPAPFTWNTNFEILDSPNSGGAGIVGSEADFDENNKPQLVGSGFGVDHWCNGTSAYTGTSCFYVGGSNTYSQSGMTATMSGHTVTLTAGTFAGNNPYIQFVDPNNIAAGTQFFRIDIVDATHAVTDAALPTEATPITISSPVAFMDAPFLVNSYNSSKTADFWAISAAVTGFRSQGIHQVAFDSQNDQALAFARMRQGQFLSFAGSDLSLVAADANTLRTYIHGANPVLDVVGATAGGAATDWLAISNGSAGNGASISVKTGLSTPVQLGLAGANGGGVKVTGNLFTTQNFFLNDGATGLGANVAAGLNVAANADLFLRVPNGGISAFIQSYGGGANFAQFNAGGATLFGGLIAAKLATAATAGVKGTVCSDANGVIYVKTTTGACL